MKLKRYYLHGDQKESSLDMFYCVLCDVSANLFDGGAL